MGEKYDVHYEKPKEDYKAYSDSSFVAGDSPTILDVFNDFSPKRITYNGEIDCDGPGDILVALSEDGTTYGDDVIVKSSEQLDIRTHIVKKIRITHSGTDSAYRARVW